MNIVKVWLNQNKFHIAAFEETENGKRSKVDVWSVHPRGAQRELTSLYKSRGWEPIGRWSATGSEHWYRFFRKS